MEKNKIIIFLLVFIFLLPLRLLAHEQYANGWHIVPNISTSCKYKTNWALYKSGKETKRYCQVIVAHRGWGDAPENSLASIENTVANGYVGVEIDLRFTKDSVPILFHDSTINRLARDNNLKEISQPFTISGLTLEELNQYNYPTTREGKVLKKYKNNKITKFEDAFAYAKSKDLLLLVDMKKASNKQIASFIQMIKKNKMENYIVWTSKKITLFQYVNEYINNGIFTIQKSDTCGDGLYCGTDAEKTKYYNLLNTGKNIIVFGDETDKDSKGYANIKAANIPEDASKYSNSAYKLNTIPQASISISKNALDMKYGKTKTITYTYNGDGKVKCKSSNANIVSCSVDKTNKTITISAVGSSDVPINVSVYGTQGKKYSATKDAKLSVNVITPVSGLTLSSTEISLNVNEVKTIKAIINPAGATNKEVTWSSSNKNVVSVEKGNLTAKSEGSAIITAKTVDGNKTATCKVVVKKHNISVDSISLNITETNMKIGDNINLVATILPSNATNKNFGWMSNNPGVATVDNGRVVAKSEGTAIITAKTVDGGKIATCKITVLSPSIPFVPVTSVSLNKTKLSMIVGKSEILKEIVLPDKATNKSVIWTSSDSNIAIVENGKVTAKSEGTAIITAKTVDGNKIANCEISIIKNNKEQNNKPKTNNEQSNNNEINNQKEIDVINKDNASKDDNTILIVFGIIALLVVIFLVIEKVIIFINVDKH